MSDEDRKNTPANAIAASGPTVTKTSKYHKNQRCSRLKYCEYLPNIASAKVRDGTFGGPVGGASAAMLGLPNGD